MTWEQTGNIPGHEAQPSWQHRVTGKGNTGKTTGFSRKDPQYTECLRKNPRIAVICSQL
jgi:hypothetical protein